MNIQIDIPSTAFVKAAPASTDVAVCVGGACGITPGRTVVRAAVRIPGAAVRAPAAAARVAVKAPRAVARSVAGVPRVTAKAVTRVGRGWGLLRPGRRVAGVFRCRGGSCR
jgi:hypothetical protein